MKNVLVVFENIPESSEMYFIQADDKTVEILKKCHGIYVNNNDDTEETQEATTLLNLMLGPRTDDNLEWANNVGVSHEYVGMFANCSVYGKTPFEPTEKIDLVIHTGWVM
ncbi:hypothetical protein JC221_223 [Yersinia phage JC221]|nr:hypothetical protein JC221_223 [Yersinia phage JC221]